MQLVHNTEVFDQAVNELAIRFIHSIALCLHGSKSVDFDVFSPDAAKSDLLFEICFKGAIEFEEQSGIEAVDTRYTPRVAFDNRRYGNGDTILVGNGLVHGKIDDPQLAEGVRRARESLK